MSNNKGDNLFLSWHPTGVLLAKADNSVFPMNISELKVIPTHDVVDRPLSVLGNVQSGKNNYVDAHIGISHPAFFHTLHEVEILAKAKAPDYFPNVVKKILTENNEGVFYHVINSGDGEPYSPDNITEKKLIISGIKTDDLLSLQQAITAQGIYPIRLECSLLATLGLLKKLAQKEKKETPVILLEVYREESILVILSSKGKPSFHKIQSGELAMCEQIRDELSLKDTLSSRKLLYSSTIDLSDIGRQVINPLFKEIAAIIGMYEVETGQSVGRLFVSNIQPNHRWISNFMASDLGMDLYDIDHREILDMLQLQVGENVKWDLSDSRYVSLFSMMGIL